MSLVKIIIIFADVTMPSSLFVLFFAVTFASCHLFPADRRTMSQSNPWRTKYINERFREQKSISQLRTRDRQPRSVSTVKVFDFSDDGDLEMDSNGEYTSATLEAGPVPEAFTICSAVMVQAWTTDFEAGDMFALLREVDNSTSYPLKWLGVTLVAWDENSQYEVHFRPKTYYSKTTPAFFPLQWTRACLSLDSVAGKLKMVVDGQLLVEEEYKREEDKGRPANLSLRLGVHIDSSGLFAEEYPLKIADMNIFKSALSVERMIGQTTAGGEECGAPGDLVNWEEAEWTLHSQAKVIEVDREWEGPCRRESQVQVFTADFEYHHDCMDHCQKISNGHSPPVTTKDEWENLTREVELITRDISSLPYMWLSATEGDKDSKLAKLDHWNDTELVNDEIKNLEATETIWRDFYTGQRLENWTKPYYSDHDRRYEDTYNCMLAYTDEPWEESWYEWQCYSYDKSCPCSYPTQPLLRLRGLCSSLIDNLYSPKQLPDNPGNMIILGQLRTRIEYNDTEGQWILTDAKHKVSASSRATKLSYVLGKHKWTISNDAFECNEGKPYATMLKLTGCAEDEFTCNDGQCVKMEERCNQEPDCRDKSDERGCQIIIVEEGYNKTFLP